MDDGRDLLIESFAAHEPPAPDTLELLSNVDAIAKAQRRNRWALRAAGMSLLSAGIVAGGIGLPGLLSQGSGSGQSVVSAADGNPANDPSPGSYTAEQEMAKYFEAGYDYTNAQQLATLWHMSDAFMNKVKAKAGLKLLEGESLPVTPDNPPAPAGQTAAEQAAQAFFNAGYDYTDAQTLATMWHTSTYGAKVRAGKDIEDGKPVPIKPSGGAGSAATSGNAATPTAIGSLKEKELRKLYGARLGKDKKPIFIPQAAATGSGADDSESPALTAYFDAGYDYTNAQQLAKIWGETDINRVKAQAGQKLLDGDTLPVKPDGQPAPPQNKAVEAFFAAGYDYNDAVKLGKMWNESSYQAKIDGGKKIENGETLPIQPGS